MPCCLWQDEYLFTKHLSGLFFINQQNYLYQAFQYTYPVITARLKHTNLTPRYKENPYSLILKIFFIRKLRTKKPAAENTRKSLV